MRKLPKISSFLQNKIGYIVAGLFIFALHIHCRNWQLLFSVVGLLVAGFTASRFIFAKQREAISILGFSSLSQRTLVSIFIAAVFGLSLGILYRIVIKEPLIPQGLNQFAIPACLIAITEEVLYRGLIQGALESSGAIGAIILASICHTSYKCALFMGPCVQAETNLYFLAMATFLGGAAFGILRMLSKSTYPAIAAHVCFDLIVYGNLAKAPWWVWS